jgi:hypothetical protein
MRPIVQEMSRCRIASEAVGTHEVTQEPRIKQKALPPTLPTLAQHEKRSFAHHRQAEGGPAGISLVGCQDKLVSINASPNATSEALSAGTAYATRYGKALCKEE